MKNPTFFIRLFALVAAMMCALGAEAIEAYANYTPSNTTLTFYYDNYRSTRTGTTYDLNTGYSFPDWRSDGTNVNVTKVVFNSSFANASPTTTYGWFYSMENLQSIIGIAYLNTSEVTNMSWMFGYCSSLANLDLSHLNTAKVTNMHAMFSNCESLTNLDVSNFNTINVTDMSWMFAYCSSLSSIDLSSFRTDNVGDMEYMFYICSDLRTIFASRYWSTAAVTSSTNMFAYCNNLVGGQGTTYDDQHVGVFRAHVDGGPSNPGYFTAVIETHAYACYTPSNTTLTFYYDNLRSTRTGTTYDLNTGSNLPGWDTDGTYANVTNVVFDSSFANARPTSTCAWFGDMEYLQTITGMTYLNTSEVTNMAWMFCWCMSLTSLDMSHFNTAKVTDMNDMFYSCSSLVELNLSSFNTSNVLNMDKMFAFCTSLTTVCVGDGWYAGRASTEDMFYHCYNIIGELGTTYNTAYDEHVGYDAAHVDLEDYPGYFVSANYLTVPYALLTADGKTLTFYHDGQRGTRRSTANTTYSFDWADNDEPYWWRDDAETEITRVVIDASFADVRPTSTYYWFGEMSKLTGITGMQYLNTSEVTDMSNMFSECIALTSLDVSHFDTKKVKYMRALFHSCSELTTLDVSHFDTRNVTDMAMMFAYCENLTTLDVRNFDTKKVTDMSGMFEQCSGLTSLDLSSFNTANVTKMGEMFSSCMALTSLDLSSFNTANVTNMSWMFHTCTNLKTISVSDGWSTAKVTQSGNMFKNCTKLVGGAGTTYNASHVDKAYAHVDGGPSNPGYFTAAGATFLRGDVDGDGQVKISDVTALINYLLSGDASAINLQAADCDQDGNIKISDVTALINYLLSGTW